MVLWCQPFLLKQQHDNTTMQKSSTYRDKATCFSNDWRLIIADEQAVEPAHLERFLGTVTVPGRPSLCQCWKRTGKIANKPLMFIHLQAVQQQTEQHAEQQTPVIGGGFCYCGWLSAKQIQRQVTNSF